MDGTGKVYVTGDSDATWGSPVNHWAGNADAFVARLDTGRPVWPARDFDGDQKSDPTVFRPSPGTWYQLRSTTGPFGFAWGAPGDLPQ